jgi:hypothetical protein
MVAQHKSFVWPECRNCGESEHVEITRDEYVKSRFVVDDNCVIDTDVTALDQTYGPEPAFVEVRADHLKKGTGTKIAKRIQALLTEMLDRGEIRRK